MIGDSLSVHTYNAKEKERKNVCDEFNLNHSSTLPLETTSTRPRPALVLQRAANHLVEIHAFEIVQRHDVHAIKLGACPRVAASTCGACAISIAKKKKQDDELGHAHTISH